MSSITPKPMPSVGYLIDNNFEHYKTAKSSQGKFINFFDNVGTQDVLLDFIKLSSQNTYVDKLFDGAVLNELPRRYTECDLGTENRAVRDILGILYRVADPEDISMFDQLFDEVTKNKDKLPDEGKFSAELTYLFKKYGEPVLNTFIDQFIDKCRDAWHQHHLTDGKKKSDDDIFTKDIMVCIDVFKSTIKRMLEPNQSWATIFANGVYFKNVILGISKTIYLHDSAKINKPFSAGPELQQPGIRKPDITIPEKNAPINIYNTANGGNATVNSNVPLSDSDFGIRLLATPRTELVNEKARLVEKYMDLRWGRAQNGGQDKFSDHVDSVVQGDPHPQHLTEVLQSPPVLQTVGASDLETELTPQPNIGLGDVNIAENTMHGIGQESISATAELPAALVPNNKNQHLQNMLTNETMDVAPELSSPLTEMDTSQNSQTKLQDRLTTGVYLESAPIVRVQGDSSINVATMTKGIQNLAHNSEALNIKQHIHDESLPDIGTLNRSKMKNDSQQLRLANSARIAFQPVKRGVKEFKFSVKIDPPLHTTSRSVDLFSRRSVDLKKPFQFIKLKQEEELKDIISNTDSMSII